MPAPGAVLVVFRALLGLFGVLLLVFRACRGRPMTGPVRHLVRGLGVTGLLGHAPSSGSTPLR
ncbi:hypothetical protein Cde04nite_30010 [Cellulomonas denverensis]|nr:hypothetical protein Cde04nite_30010 [Cellulomonas denverensis]